MEISRPCATKNISQQKLTPYQELERTKHTDEFHTRRLLHKRITIRNLASSIAKSSVSNSWVTRLLNTYQYQLTSQWNNAMNAMITQLALIPNNGYTLSFYTRVLLDKLLTPSIHKMDEKGLLIGAIGKSKRVFSRQRWKTADIKE